MSHLELTSPAFLKLLTDSNSSQLLIDVREAVEYQELHLRGSRNMPLSTLESNLSDLNPTTSLVVFCQSGSRAQQAANLFTKGGFNQVHVFPEGMDYLSLHSKTRLEYPRIQHLWSIDRQFRFALGILIAVGLFGKVFVSEWFLIIPTIICAGLIFTSLINRCYFRSFIALLPWNQNNIAT